MNRIKVQLEPGNPYNSGASVYLDIDGARRLQVAFNITDYVRIRGKFDEAAAEFAYFTSVIYACDRAINREKPPGDRWTREFFVETPVADPDKWSATVDLAEAMLEFLTGDLWHLDFIKSTTPLFGREFKRKRRNRRFCQKTRMSGNTVSLFSGGLEERVGQNWTGA